MPPADDVIPCRLVTRLWAKQPGAVFCISTKSEVGGWRDHFFGRTEMDDMERLVQARRDHDVYFCPHGFSRPTRRKQFAVSPCCLYADLDEVDPEAIAWIPTIAIESSPGRYVGVWVTDRPIREQLNRRLTYTIGADRGGWDFTQVLRVPGTLNHKYSPALLVRTLWACGPKYRVRDLERRLSDAPKTHRSILDVNIGAHDGPEVARKFRIPQARLNWAVGDRSRQVWGIGCDMRQRGANPDEVAAVLWASAAFQSKWGQDIRRLQAEVSKLFGLRDIGEGKARRK
jgi:hypothetical protein